MAPNDTHAHQPEQAMLHLLTFRVVGHPAIANSQWIRIERGTSILRGARDEQLQALLQMLQTINPPYDIHAADPFRDLPRSFVGPEYNRRIIPSKKTAAIAVFAASPDLARELAVIDPLYFAADRVEFGRRRDYSLWTNFVELAGSARWSEMEPAVSEMLSRIGREGETAVNRLHSVIAGLRGTDRIRGQIESDLEERLEALRPFLPEKLLSGLDTCIHIAKRAQHFRQARQKAWERLPCLLSLNAAALGFTTDPAADSLAAAAGFSPLDHLAGLLAPGQAEKAGIARSLERINGALQSDYPHLALHCRATDGRLSLESGKGPYARPFTELPPLRRIEALIAAATAIHQEARDTPPIWLIDVSDIALSAEERAELLQFLHRHGEQWQCLVIPGRDLLALVEEIIAARGKDTFTLLNLVDVQA
jgi:hypothetical protein